MSCSGPPPACESRDRSDATPNTVGEDVRAKPAACQDSPAVASRPCGEACAAETPATTLTTNTATRATRPRTVLALIIDLLRLLESKVAHEPGRGIGGTALLIERGYLTSLTPVLKGLVWFRDGLVARPAPDAIAAFRSVVDSGRPESRADGGRPRDPVRPGAMACSAARVRMDVAHGR